MALEFTHVPHPNPTSPERRADILANSGFGKYFTDHMVRIDWNVDKGWHSAQVLPYGPISLDPSTAVLHYAQEIFDGLKAYSRPDGSVVAFRPEANAARLQNSARRMAMPELPADDFLASLRELLAVDHDWVPAPGGESSLYLRPFMFASDAELGVHPASNYQYYLIASPAQAYFAGGGKPITVWLSTDYVRAAPGGTGAAKTGGNYAASLVAQAEAAAHGAQQVVWLDAIERRYIEEVGAMNLMFVFGSGPDARIVTPELSGSLLPGITRDSLLKLAVEAGFGVEERKISAAEVEKGVAEGDITEIFGCGTAAVITSVGRVLGEGVDYTVGNGEPGEVALALRDTVTGIQRGTFADTHGWITELYRPA